MDFGALQAPMMLHQLQKYRNPDQVRNVYGDLRPVSSTALTTDSHILETQLSRSDRGGGFEISGDPVLPFP